MILLFFGYGERRNRFFTFDAKLHRVSFSEWSQTCDEEGEGGNYYSPDVFDLVGNIPMST